MADIVNARVPAEIRRQGNAALVRLGATPTQLINAAYEYVIATGQLPSAKPGASLGAASPGDAVTHRRLCAEDQRALAASVARSTVAVPESFWKGMAQTGTESYKDIIAAGRRAEYEALA